MPKRSDTCSARDRIGGICGQRTESSSGLCLRHELDAIASILEALTPEQAAAVHQVVNAVGLDPDAWLEVPALRQVFAMAAISNLIRELEAAGVSHSTALGRAARRVGIRPGTARKWFTRWTDRAA